MNDRKTSIRPAYVLASVGLLAWSFSSLASAQTPSGAISQWYSKVDDVRANKTGICKAVRVAGDKDNPVVDWRCPAGPGAWPVTMFSADARNYVWFGKKAKRGVDIIDALDGAFADPHGVVEWRLRGGEPYAAIHRYFFDGKQALTVHRLNRDKTSCVAAVVAVESGHDANAEAVRIADEVVPAFRCGDDQMVVTAKARSSS